MGMADTIHTRTIYNAIDPALGPDGTSIDHNKLVFFSSPNKGLKFTLDAFAAMRRAMPGLHLVVGNPGYKADRFTDIEGVSFLGPQPQTRILAEVRTALCTFCPNFVIPETFGLVFAESMAVGTPVLTHDCGAAYEVIGDDRQVLPVTSWQRAYERSCQKLPPLLRRGPARLAARLGLFDAHIERIRSWRARARPQASPDQRFSLEAVVKKWKQTLSP